MQVDKQTYKDLEIFISPEEGKSIFDILDSTITTGGKYRLREKFLNPSSEIKQILSIQEVVSFLSVHLDVWKYPFTDERMKSLERYTSSNIDPIQGTKGFNVFLQSLHYYIIDRNTYSYLKESIFEVVDSIVKFINLFNISGTEKLPILLNDILVELKGLKGEPTFKLIFEKVLNKKKLSFTEVYYFDGLLRDVCKTKLKTVIQLAYEFDALLSMAKATTKFNLCFPEIIKDKTTKLEVDGLYHLMIENPQPYSISLNDDNDLIFLTGSNMAGKTTFLKSISVAIYLTHIGMSVPARSMKTVTYDRLITSITVNENIFKGYSYFFSEVKRVKQVAEALNRNEKIFVLFDELFKGTNVSDAYSASNLIISGLVQWKESLFIISSHLFELETELKKYPEICYYYFESEIQNGKPVFSYNLKQGVSNACLGLVIIEQEKIMELLKLKTHDNN